ncbi:MAG: thymidylate synthase [Chloroflexi bacterium RIFCSPLOWO2_12_FULL_71_12]|nr:MAG: thymidylate synthase [Chloroflexi bacterium RIFCSPLOWO2_12_FULL_71_12]
MQQYLSILRKIMDEGVDRDDRTGTGTRAIFGEVMRFRMRDGFPAVTTKRLAFRSVIAELLWFLAASSDVNELHALGVRIWDGNAFADYWRPRARFEGDAGRNYGQQWRDWDAPGGRRIDQLADLVRRIGSDPSSRRHLVTAWDPAEIEDTSLPACHAFFQVFVREGRLSLLMYQRSADMFLGVPFNAAQYALVLHFLAQMTELEPDELIHVLADAHVYRTHMDAVREQLGRDPYPAPKLWLDPALRTLDDVVARYREIVFRAQAGEKPGPLLDGVARLVGYQHHPAIKAEMAV